MIDRGDGTDGYAYEAAKAVWGERACVHANSEERPCVPRRASCNVTCKHFRWNSTPSHMKMWPNDVPDFKNEMTRNQRKRRRKQSKK